MIGQRQLLATVDVRELCTVRWGPLRQLFTGFAEEIELGRYLRRMLAHSENHPVVIEPHRDANGLPSTHVFDIRALEAA